MKYVERLTQAMTFLGEQERTVFLGQAVAYPGTGMTRTFAGVPRSKLRELPVMEEVQLGMAIGMSLVGMVPICVYPRINFLLLAVNQLVNHLDALPRYSAYRPKVIIRTSIATPVPLDPGPQHLGDYTGALAQMLQCVHVEKIVEPSRVLPAYRDAWTRSGSSLLVEFADRYEADDMRPA